MLDVLHADYIRTARAKGVPMRRVVLKHAFRNALIPLVTVVALDTAFFIGGVIITEQIFAIAGMGQLFLTSLNAGDAPTLLAWFVLVAVVVIVLNLVADILYGVLDPRIRADMTTVGGADIPTDDLDLELPPGAEPVARSNWQLFWRRFFRHKVAVASIFVLVVLIVVCFGAHWIAPYHRNEQHLLDTATGPNAKHWFGTDDLGRDQLTEILYAGQVSLKIGLVVAFLSTVVGVIVGALAGYYGKWVDQGLSRVTDLFLIVPDLAILAVALKKLGQTTTWIVVVLAVLGWTYVARVVRGQVLSAKETEYVEAARASGASDLRIIVRHILPNCFGPIMVNATLAIATAIVAESTLSFLGFGVQPPNNSWGLMISDAESAATDFSRFYLILFPGLMLLLVVLAVNFLGDGLRDAFDAQADQ